MIPCEVSCRDLTSIRGHCGHWSFPPCTAEQALSLQWASTPCPLSPPLFPPSRLLPSSSLLLREYARCSQASEPLCWLFPLPGTLFL